MKRRTFFRYAQVSLLAGLGVVSGRQLVSAQTSGSLSVQWLGHTCFLFTGSGQRILVNPFRPVGCTKNYRPPKVASDIVMISSRLLDEGYIEGLPGRPKLLFEPGIYKVNGLQIQGIRTNHDRLGGVRFGTNICWLWNQGGIKILHLGGIASPISLEQRILMGRPDLLLIPVGGSDKAYTAAEAKEAIATLEPKLVIPTHYRTGAADPKACNLAGVDEFLKLMSGTTVRRTAGNSLVISRGSLPNPGPVIQLLNA